jgi:hypothetical protein
MDQPYIPIDCERHDELLALATLRRPCTLDNLAGVIEDVYADTGVEYLRLRGGPTVRLDWIRALNGRPFP